MMKPPIHIRLCEKDLLVPSGTRLLELREQHKPGADVVVLNGFPAAEDCVLAEGDEVVLITRGEIPREEDLEALMAARHTPGVHDVLKDAVVGIAGLGGLGSSVAVALARVGIGTLVLADFDVVEPSNLNRQQYFIDQIGQFKTEAISANLRRIHPGVTLEPHRMRLDAENVPNVFASVQVLVEAFDTAEAKAMLVESFARARPGVPMVAASGLAGHGAGNPILTRKLGNALWVVGDLEAAAAPGMGLMAPRVGIAAHHQANAVIRLLLGESPTA